MNVKRHEEKRIETVLKQQKEPQSLVSSELRQKLIGHTNTPKHTSTNTVIASIASYLTIG